MANSIVIGFYLSTFLFTLIQSAGSEVELQKASNTISSLESLHGLVLPNSINSFGYKLMIEMMKNNKDKNIIISPTGIAGLLAMTLLGSVGRSYDELADVLGFSHDVRINRKNHEEFGDLLINLNTNTTTSKTLYADAVFIDEHSRLRDAYSLYLQEVYNGEAINVNFMENTITKTLINEWVSNHTNNRIPEFLKEPLPKGTQAVLLSALYFGGQWLNPFIPEFTHSMPFKRPGGEIMVDLMLNVGKFSYAHCLEYDLQILALPYNDSVTTLYVLKPYHPENTNLAELLQRLDDSKINKIIEKMSPKTTVVRFPKFDVQASSRLEDSLKSLGIQSIFVPNVANFALMIDKKINKTEDEVLIRIEEDEPVSSSNLRKLIDNLPNPGVYIDTIIHDVKLTIDEYGTEAVAVTSGVLARTATLFYVDSPFYMFIRNERTKLVTFSAVINDPTS